MLKKISYFMKNIPMNKFESMYMKARGKEHNIFTFKFDKFFKSVGTMKADDPYKRDMLLQLDATLYMNLGKDSVRKEKDEVRKRSRQIYREIRLYDKEMGDSFLKHQDKS